MKKNFVYFVSFILLAFCSCTKEETMDTPKPKVDLSQSEHFISVEQAIENASDFLANFNQETRIATISPEVDNVVTYRLSDVPETETRSGSVEDCVAFYAINYKDNNGFVIAASDDRYVPVYAYVPEGSFSSEREINCGFGLFLKGIVYKVSDSNDTSLMAENNVLSIYTSSSPKLTTKWGGGSPLNAYAQGSSSTSMSVALAQIAGYFESPTSYIAYNTNSTANLNWTSIMAESATYNGYLLIPSANTDSLSRFMRSVEDGFTSESMYASGVCVSRVAWWGDYNSSEMLALYDNSSSISYIQTIINQGRLLYTRGHSGYDSYAWVIDGYNGNYFHCNWGMLGNFDGYFLVSGFAPLPSASPYQYNMAYCPMFHISEYK